MANKCGSLLALTVLSAFSICLSCRRNPTGEKPSLESRMAVLQNPVNMAALTREQTWFADSLDVEALYASPLHIGYITAWVSSFVSPDIVPVHCETLFGRVAVENSALLRPLVADICRVLKDRRAESAAVSVAVLPFGIDARQNPEIAERLLTSTLLPGTEAPVISGLSPLDKQPAFTILLFHESACRSCQALIWDIRQKYDRLLKNGVRIVTVSTDKNEKIWSEYAKTLPWPDKLCDFLGFYSPNMENWGVAATPTLFLIDGNGMVTGQFDTTDDLWNTIFNSE